MCFAFNGSSLWLRHSLQCDVSLHLSLWLAMLMYRPLVMNAHDVISVMCNCSSVRVTHSFLFAFGNIGVMVSGKFMRLLKLLYKYIRIWSSLWSKLSEVRSEAKWSRLTEIELTRVYFVEVIKQFINQITTSKTREKTHGKTCFGQTKRSIFS